MVDAAAFALGGVFSNVVRSARVGSKAGVEVGEDYVKVGSDKLVKETPLSRTEIELGTSPTPRSRAAELVGMTGVETGGGIRLVVRQVLKMAKNPLLLPANLLSIKNKLILIHSVILSMQSKTQGWLLLHRLLKSQLLKSTGWKKT